MDLDIRLGLKLITMRRQLIIILILVETIMISGVFGQEEDTCMVECKRECHCDVTECTAEQENCGQGGPPGFCPVCVAKNCNCE